MSPQDRSGGAEEATLGAAGMTLLALLLNIGLTVGFGIHAPIVWRIVAGLATSVGLALVIAFGSRRTNLLVRVTRWLTRYGSNPLDES